MKTENVEETEQVSVGVWAWVKIEVPVGTDEDRCVDIAISKIYENPDNLRLQELEVVQRESW